MLKGLSRIRPWLLDVICLVVFGIGVFLRWKYIIVEHDPRHFVDTDIKAYADAARLWFKPGYVLKPADVFLPPGAAYLFAALFRLDPTKALATNFMFVVSLLVPIVFGVLAWAGFGKKVGKLTLIFASLYPPLITYGGFFFPELPLALLIGLTMALYLWAGRMQSIRIALVMSTVAGFFLSAAMAFRLGALPAMVAFVAIFTWFFDGSSRPTLEATTEGDSTPGEAASWPVFAGSARRAKRLMLACFIVGAIPLTIAMSARCTSGNDNRFCLVSNRSSAEILLGHYGRIQSIVWAPPKAPAVELAYVAGSGHGYSETKRLAFAATDEPRNLAMALEWVSHNWSETLLVTAEHVYDTFGGSLAWPKTAKNAWLIFQASQYFYCLCVLLPAVFLMISIAVKRGLRALLKSGEFLFLSPLIGVLAAVLVTSGEERNRIPFDALFLVCAILFYQHFLAKTSEAEHEAPAPFSPQAGAFRKLLLRVKPWHTDVACILVFLGSVVARWQYIARFHDPRKFVFSDPATYVAIGERWIKPGAKTVWVDAMVPPGIGYFLAGLFKADPTKWLAVVVMFVLTSLIPAAIFVLAWGMFNRSVAKWAMVLACVYVPLIAYGGFFMTEIPLTILLLSSLCAFVGAMRVKSRWKTLFLALFAGFLASLAASFKLAALPVVLMFALITLFFYEGPVGGVSAVDSSTETPPKRRLFNLAKPMRAIKLITLAGVLAGALPIMVAMSARCTSINDGNFCLVCTNGQQNFLLGHYGRIQSITWKSRYGVFAFGSASAAQHSYGQKKEVPFGINEGAKNSAEGWKWMRENPSEAIVLVLEHVFDTFGGSVAWPPNVTYAWLPSQLSQYALLTFLMVPALWLAVEIARKRGIKGLLASREFLTLSPHLGIVATVLAATGEARYRIPVDGLFMIVGVEFYRRYLVLPWLQAAKTNETPEPEAAHAEQAAVDGEADKAAEETEDATEAESESETQETHETDGDASSESSEASEATDSNAERSD